MAIEIHIRVRDSDWNMEHEFADAIADKIQTLITDIDNVNIPILVIPVEDPENEMEPLTK